MKPNTLIFVDLPSDDVEACARFYTEGMGMQVDWQPDADNVYLSSGPDNLALHRVAEIDHRVSALDHLGFVCATADDVRAFERRNDFRHSASQHAAMRFRSAAASISRARARRGAPGPSMTSAISIQASPRSTRRIKSS